jgi:hypothetical protein
MRTVLLLMGVLIIIGCGNKNTIPPDVITPQKMQPILWDMMRADQFLSDYVFSRDSAIKKDSASIAYYSQVFAFHKVSKEAFQHSFSFYKNHPGFLKVIMDSLSKSDAPTDIVPARISAEDTIKSKEPAGKTSRLADTILQPRKFKKQALRP